MSSPPGTQPRFLDSFDSVRKHQAPTLTDGQIKLHLLLGETLRISQTQAFDSAAILSYGAEAEFLQLIRHGAVEIVMQPSFASPWDAFASKVKDTGFHLSAWPEFEEVGRDPQTDPSPKRDHLFSRTEATALVEEATRRKKVPWDLPHDLDRRWRSLMEISRAHEEARTWRSLPAAHGVTISLGDRIQAAAERHTSQPHLHPYLKQLSATGLAQPHHRNDRSLYHRQVQTDPTIDPGIRRSLHSIIDMFYNQVIAESLQSAAELTTHAHDAKEVIEQQHQSPAGGSILVGDSEAGSLEGLTWPLLLELREIFDDQELTREKKAALFRERCVIDAVRFEDKSGWAFKILPRFTGAGLDVAISHALTLVVNGLVPGGLTTAGSIIMDMATNVSSAFYLKTSERIENRIQDHRRHAQERNIVALLEERLDRKNNKGKTAAP
jgi:hypothetical protein